MRKLPEAKHQTLDKCAPLPVPLFDSAVPPICSAASGTRTVIFCAADDKRFLEVVGNLSK